nr:ORF7a protein [Severe acute respiratory syndrome coronavirus 2]BDU98034.1 ORF7a protein [Severe acute respiratory syndrome coronavirus 2]
MKIILFLALITLATCELYHYQECVRGTTVLLKAAIVFITLCFTLKRKTE